MITLLGIPLTLACEQKPLFIPDIEPQDPKGKKDVSLTSNKKIKTDNHLNLFLKLPYKILPLKPTERQLALKHKEITSRIVDKQTIVRHIAAQSITEMSCISYTIDREPIAEVIYTWDNPGLIKQSHSTTYHLTRKSNGWLSLRVK